MLAVFGSVDKKVVSVIEERLTYLLRLQGSTIRYLWLDRTPLAVDRNYVDKEIVDKMLRWTNRS